MVKDLGKADDIQESLDSLESRGGQFLRMPEGKTPIYILNSEYSDGYVHWVKTAEGNQRIICAGGLEGKGFAPDECGICKYVAELYQRAKKIESKHGENDDVKSLRRIAGRTRAKYEAHFLAVKGELVKEKQKDGSKRSVPDFDEGQVGILTFTRQQFEDFISLRKSEEFPFMKDGNDLVNRVILVDKKKRGGSDFATSKFIPSKHVTDPPDVEYEEDDFDLDEAFAADEQQVERAVEYLRSGKVESDDDEDVELEDEEEDEDEEEEEEVSDDFLNDVEDEEEEEEEEASDDEEEDDFEDDTPGEEEEEPPKKKTSSKRRSTKPQSAAGSKKSTASTKRKGSSKRSR